MPTKGYRFDFVMMDDMIGNKPTRRDERLRERFASMEHRRPADSTRHEPVPTRVWIFEDSLFGMLSFDFETVERLIFDHQKPKPKPEL